MKRLTPQRFTVFFLSCLLAFLLSPGVSFSEQGDAVSFELAKKDFIRGMAFYNNMQYLASVEFFRKAVNTYPHYYTAREYLARSYKLAGFYDAAMKEWNFLQHVSPGNVAVLSKIDTLRFRKAGEKIKSEFRDLIHIKSYNARDLDRFSFSRPVDIAVDESKNIYVTSFENGRLVKLDTNGNGIQVVKPTMGGRVYGVDYRKGRIAVSDFTDDHVLVLDTEGSILFRFGSPGSGKGEFHGPQGLCFDNAGNIFVVDSGNSRIQKFSSDGSYILSFGKKGRYQGELMNPTDVAVVDKTVYVTDTDNGRVVRFDIWGNYIDSILDKELDTPRGITANGEMLLISDEKKGLLYYNVSNEKKQWFNRWEKKNRFSRLVASTVDRDGYLYCLDHDVSSLRLFAPVQNLYSNLEIDITSVDIKQFPVIAFTLHVRNRAGEPLYGLKASNFTIIEDKSLVTNHSINYIKDKPASASMVLCVDRSYQTRGWHNDIPWVADFILKKMRKNDSLQVANFNDELWTGNKFDWSRRRAIKALRKREYGKGKNFGKALYQSLSELTTRLNRRGLILITDGSVSDDSFSVYSADIIVNYAREHFIPIYIITFKEAATVLKTIASETGGSCFRAGKVDSLRKLYDSIKNAEEHRYVAVYSSHKNTDLRGYWSDVKIQVHQKEQKGVEWGGYFVP